MPKDSIQFVFFRVLQELWSVFHVYILFGCESLSERKQKSRLIILHSIVSLGIRFQFAFFEQDSKMATKALSNRLKKYILQIAVHLARCVRKIFLLHAWYTLILESV